MDRDINNTSNDLKAVSERPKRDFATFEKANKDMVATTNSVYRDTEWGSRHYTTRLRTYKVEDVIKIIESGSLLEQQRLSRNYFERDGFYRKLLVYYATLFLYNGIVIPNPRQNAKNLSKDYIQKRYFNATGFLDKIDTKTMFQHFALEALIDGTYYGVVQTLDKDGIVILDLPASYCCTRYKNKKNVDLIEFDVRFFDTIRDENVRETTLKVYPKKVRNWYNRYKRGEVTSPWAFIPAEEGLCFKLYDGKPFFLNVIPETITYEESVGLEKERNEEELKKIVTIHIPHLADGTLLFEPDEVAVMHKGAVDMTKKDKNLSVLTSYGDIDAIVTRTSSDAQNNALEKMMKNIYYKAGTSSQLFAADSNLALETSINNDVAMMQPLITKFEKFITDLLNRLYGNSNVTFTYSILPVTQYNQIKYAESAFKLATTGYSFLIPSVAMGISQNNLRDLKALSAY